MPAHNEGHDRHIQLQGQTNFRDLGGYKVFFKHVDHPMRLMAELLHNRRHADEVMGILAREETVRQESMSKVGRNEPCPCGSGKKYKQCHGLKRHV